jgi:hypothetical protein
MVRKLVGLLIKLVAICEAPFKSPIMSSIGAFAEKRANSSNY